MISALLLAVISAAGATTTHSDPVELDAATVTYDQTSEIADARGAAVLRSPNYVIRADEIRYHRKDGRVKAKGHVTLVSGMFAALADGAEVDLNRMEADFQNGQVLQKQNVSPLALRELETPQALEATGENAVAIRGRHIRRVDVPGKPGETQFLDDGIALVPCYCNVEGGVDWQIRSAHATINPGGRAHLAWPVVYVGKAPVFAFPYLAMPLKNRATGLLIPSPNFAGQSGPHVTLPFFLTLGQSHDLTFTPQYFFGASTLRPAGVKGVRLITEWNYAPTSDIRGRMTLDLLNDRLPLRSPVDASYAPNETRVRGLRGQWAWQHRQELGKGWGDFVDASIASDGFLFRDLVTDVVAQIRGYTRSSATVFHRTDDSYLGLDLVLRQDVTSGYRIDGSPPREGYPYGPRVFQRLPALSASMPERQLWGPLRVSLDGELARFAPLRGRFGDEGANGLFDFPLAAVTTDPTQGDGFFTPRAVGAALGTGEREAVERLDLRPRFSLTAPLGRFAKATPYLAYRQTLYHGELSGDFSSRGYPLAGVSVESEVSRQFGSPEDAIRHSVVPYAEIRWAPKPFGRAPHLYDERDVAVPEDGLLQAVVELRQALFRKSGPVGAAEARELLALYLGQTFDLRPVRPAGTLNPSTRGVESYARLRLSAGPATLDLDGRYDLPNQRLSMMIARGSVSVGKKTSFYTEYLNLWGQGSFSLRRTLDSLVGPAVAVGEAPGNAGRTQTLRVGVNTGFGPWGLGYSALFNPSPLKDLPVPQYVLAEQLLQINYTPPCRCFTAGLYAVTRGPPNRAINRDYGFNFTIARLGSAGMQK